MSIESILNPVVEIRDEETAQRLLDILDSPVSEKSHPSTDCVRGLDGMSEYIEHALVANNFVITIGSRMVEGKGRVFERVPYRLPENDYQDIVPDVSIIGDVKKRTAVAFTTKPCFVMEVISSELERTVCRKRMEVYREVKVPECWIVDWNKKRIEMYLFATADGGELEKYLKKIITEENKEELEIMSLRNLSISFEELFADI